MALGRILVIDDEPQIHRFLKPALEAAGYDVERADRADEGLRLAAARAPDVVLLDLGLPDLDGLVVLERAARFQPSSGHRRLGAVIGKLKKLPRWMRGRMILSKNPLASVSC